MAYWIGKLGKNLSAVLIGLSFSASMWAMQSETCQRCGWVGYLMLAEYMIFSWMIFHLVGPSWTQAEHTLSLLPPIDK